MSEEDQAAGVTALPKFNMPSHESEMTSKDVKSLALRHGVPLGHWFSFEKRVGKGAGGQIFQETFSSLKGWKKRFLFLDMRAIPDPMAWRHHDSDVNDPIPEDGFHASNVQLLTKQVVDLRPVPFGLLFHGGLATTWDFPDFRPVFKDTEGNVVTMSEFLRFPFLSDASISKGPPLTSQDRIEQHTTRPLPFDQPIPEKTYHQKGSRHGNDGEEGSRPKTKRRKIVARQDSPDASEATSSPRPIQTFDSTKANPSSAVAATAKSHHVDEGTETLQLRASGGQSRRALVDAATEVVQSSPGHQSAHHSPSATQMASPQRPVRRGNVDEGESDPMWCRELMVHLAPPAVHEESNALDNATALERAWFSLAQGALAQTNILERFEHLQTEFNRLVEIHTRIRLLEDQNNELSQMNNEQSLRIKELEDILAKKDYALVYAERINVERAQEKEKLVTQLGKTEMEKFYYIRKLLPTVVERLLQSYEYKKSLSKPFNIAIQAGWGKRARRGAIQRGSLGNHR
ncbi:hypothetical protein Tco_0645227 [Tanacetum coccineum]